MWIDVKFAQQMRQVLMQIIAVNNFQNGITDASGISTTQFQLIFAEPTKKQAFNLDLVILACFANEPISMMAATFQSDINHQSQVAHQSSI